MAKSVLVVHHDPSLRRFLRLKLEGVGTPVLEAPSNGRAIELLEGGDHPVAAVICGAQCTEHTPATFVQAVRATVPRPHVFFFTSRAPSLDGHLLDGVQIFPKPDGLADLIEASRVVADGREGAG
jgi:CheY-like chemotaxis protein